MADVHLVVRLGSFGDVMLTTGVLASWHDSLGCRFLVITRDEYAPIFYRHPGVEKVIPVKPEALSARGWWDFCNYLKNRYPSMKLIDLHGNLRTFFFKRLWPGKVHSYPKMSMHRRLYAKTGLQFFKNRLLEKNVPQRYASALSLDIPDQFSLTPRIYLQQHEILKSRALIKDHNPDRKTICVHPYATHQAKAWPPEQWKILVRLLQAADLDWIIIGQNNYPLFPNNPRDLTNQTSIRQTGAVISNCQALVTGDSGPMHLATAVGTRVVALFGPTSREWGFYPTGKHDLVIESHLPCRPCSLHGKFIGQCKARCMTLLEPEQVMKAVRKTLY